MGLIHSRSKKQRNKAEAELLREQAKQVRDERLGSTEEERLRDLSPLRQPTLGAALAAIARRRKNAPPS